MSDIVAPHSHKNGVGRGSSRSMKYIASVPATTIPSGGVGKRQTEILRPAALNGCYWHRSNLLLETLALSTRPTGLATYRSRQIGLRGTQTFLSLTSATGTHTPISAQCFHNEWNRTPSSRRHENTGVDVLIHLCGPPHTPAHGLQLLTRTGYHLQNPHICLSLSLPFSISLSRPGADGRASSSL